MSTYFLQQALCGTRLEANETCTENEQLVMHLQCSTTSYYKVQIHWQMFGVPLCYTLQVLNVEVDGFRGTEGEILHTPNAQYSYHFITTHLQPDWKGC